MEIWKDIPGQNGFYQASNIGRIRSVDRVINGKRYKINRKGGIIKQSISKNGYCHITLQGLNGVKKNFSVHRLILSSFIGNSELHCNHINGIKTDNRIENLEWVTQSENMKHAHVMNLVNLPKGSDHFNSKLTNEIVLNIRENKYNLTQNEFCALYDVGQSCISAIQLNKKWRHI